MKNLLRKIKEKLAKLWPTIIAKMIELWLILRPKMIGYLKSLTLISLLWLQRNLNRFLQRYIDKLQSEKETKPKIEVSERSGDCKGYEVYED